MRNISNAPLRFLFLTLFAVAFGVEEAIVVVYLRLIPAQHGQIAPDTYPIEIGREICTIVVLVCVASIAGARPIERLRHFFVAFGVWDIIYYVALWGLSGNPTFNSDDVLFLIPIPWVGPVWAVMAFATALVLLGAFGIAARRAWVLIVGLLLGWLSFVYVPFASLVSGQGFHMRLQLEPSLYPLWLFVPAIACVLLALPLPARSRQA